MLINFFDLVRGSKHRLTADKTDLIQTLWQQELGHLLSSSNTGAIGLEVTSLINTRWAVPSVDSSPTLPRLSV